MSDTKAKAKLYFSCVTSFSLKVYFEAKKGGCTRDEKSAGTLYIPIFTSHTQTHTQTHSHTYTKDGQ